MRAIMAANLGLVLAGLLTFMLMGASQAIYGPALPAFARAFGLEGAETGILISAHWVGSALGVASMFLWGSRVSPRVALGAMMVGSALVAIGAAWAMTLLGACLFGVGYGASTALFNRRFLAIFGASGPAMVALLNAVFGLGAIVAPLGFVAMGSSIGWSFGILSGLAALTFLVARQREALDAGLKQGSGFVWRPGILAYGAVMIGAESVLIGLGPSALMGLGESEAGAARLQSLFFGAFLAVRLALVGLSLLVPAFGLLAMSLVLATMSGLVILFVSPALGFVAMGVAAGVFFPVFFVAASQQMGDDPRVSAAILGAALAGGILSPVVLGVVMARFGDVALFWVLTVGMGAAALMALGQLAWTARSRTQKL